MLLQSRLITLVAGAALLAPPHRLLRAPPPLLAAGRRAARRHRSRGGGEGNGESGLAGPVAATPLGLGGDGARPTDVEGFVALAATHQRLGQPRKALALYHEAVDLGCETPPVFAAVTRALLKLQRVDLALELQRAHGEPPDARSAVTLLGALCRKRRLGDAAELLAALEAQAPLPLTPEPPPPLPAADAAAPHERRTSEPLWRAVRSTLLPTLALAHLRGGDPAAALPLLRRLPGAAAAAPPPLPTLVELLRACGKARCLPGVYACLEAIARAGLEPDAEALQVLADALVHEVRFVTGGVSMDTLPGGALPEAAFVGRSNVGKSSLVNMLLGRRALAYTSKTPGKTQQYNYFAVNPHRAEGEPGHFHLVDMPGLGFARVPAAQRAAWAAFLRRYLAERGQLRLLLHLVDGQVGPVETDEALMRLVAEAQAEERAAPPPAAGAPAARGWAYAIVLTKMDKRRSGVAGADAAERKVRAALARAGCAARVQLVRTSAKSRLGRDEVWRVMRSVVLPDEPLEEAADAAADEEAASAW